MSGREFTDVLRAGRNEVFLSSVRGLGFREGRLLSLGELTRVVKPEGESWLGVRQIRVDRIIGSEDRSDDFSRSFLPLNKSLANRWMKVRDLFLSGSITEAIRVFEYGGYYFVRDGNHRVSVAKTHRIEFMDAEVTSLSIPVKLPAQMSTRKIPIFATKLKFHRETRIFDHIPEEQLGDAHPYSWEILRALIDGRLRQQMAEKKGAQPEYAELFGKCFRILHENIRELILREAAALLFPGKYELDIFADAMALWMRLPPDAAPSEAFARLIRRAERRRGILSLGHILPRTHRWIFSSEVDEKRFFLQMSRLEQVRPGASIHEGNRRWYRFLARQLMQWHLDELRKRLGRRPYHDELVASWYDELYAPAAELHRRRGITIPFPVFYMGWMKWERQTAISQQTKTGRETGLPESLDAYLSVRGSRDERLISPDAEERPFSGPGAR